MKRAYTIPTLSPLIGSSSEKEYVVGVMWEGHMAKLPVYAYSLEQARELARKHNYTLSVDEQEDAFAFEDWAEKEGFPVTSTQKPTFLKCWKAAIVHAKSVKR